MSTGNVLSANPGSWPSPAEEELGDMMSFDEWLGVGRADVFMTEMSGDGLRKEGILRGDWLIMEQGRRPRAGDLVAAQREEIFLVSRWEELRREENVRVLGVVTSVVRKY